MNPPTAWPAKLLAIARYAALASALALLVAGPGHRLRLVPFEVAFKGPFLIGVLAALAAFMLAGVALLTTRGGRSEPRAWRNGLAFAFGAVVVIVAAHWYGQLRSASLLHDVSTDTVSPPPFVEAAPRRAADHATNSLDYVADYSVDGAAVNAPELQKELYPDLRPILLRAKKPAEGFALAEKAARAMGWEIVAVVADEFRIEATSTSPFFGLKDDIAIRVRSERAGRGTVIDIRSASRIGANDAGANARDIREFADRLKTMN
ncbi:MAG TPA: DUF1499 domain-containing protein [Steroidobacteraceae bacterium]|nr:DUF1499 domain-containing protein [Steroidobacteraceae bacterium]